MLITIVTEASSHCALLSRVSNTAVSRGLNLLYADAVGAFVWGTSCATICIPVAASTVETEG